MEQRDRSGFKQSVLINCPVLARGCFSPLVGNGRIHIWVKFEL
jgi:hypothetical protein